MVTSIMMGNTECRTKMLQPRITSQGNLAHSLLPEHISFDGKFSFLLLKKNMIMECPTYIWASFRIRHVTCSSHYGLLHILYYYFKAVQTCTLFNENLSWPRTGNLFPFLLPLGIYHMVCKSKNEWIHL